MLMDNERGINKIKDSYLIAFLSILIIIIIGLTVWIVIIKTNAPNDSSSSDAEYAEVEADDAVDTDEEYDLFEGETIEDAKRRYAQDEEWSVQRKEIKSKAAQILDSESPDVEAVKKLFNEGIEKAIEWKRYDIIASYLYYEKTMFLEKGLKHEALDALTSVDPELITDPLNRYNYFSEIVELAQELGESDIVAKYEVLRKDSEAAYNKEYQDIQRVVDTTGTNNEEDE